MIVPAESDRRHQAVACLICAHDISLNGLSFDTSTDIPPHTVLRIEATSKRNGEIVSLPGLVKWRRQLVGGRGHRVGVELLGAPDEAMIAWGEYVSDSGGA